MGCISYYITALVINSLGGGHTHTNMHTDIRRQSNSKKPDACRPSTGTHLIYKVIKNPAVLASY